jgi:hypothetical protein
MPIIILSFKKSILFTPYPKGSKLIFFTPFRDGLNEENQGNILGIKTDNHSFYDIKKRSKVIFQNE